MKPPASLLAATMLVLTTGCATIIDGGGQVISVNTVPQGAACDFMRDGDYLGSIASTPGSLAVDKSRKTLVVTCRKAGYEPVMGSSASHLNGAIAGDILFGGPIGLIVDEATAADYYYSPTIFVTFPQPFAAPYIPLPPRPEPKA